MAQSSDEKQTNSVLQRNSRYVHGGLTDKFNNRLGWWEKRKIAKDISDYTITVRSGEVGRPDLIAYRAYGNAKYAWIVLQFNNIVDINDELIVGSTLKLPTQRRLMFDVLTQSAGGNPINRK